MIRTQNLHNTLGRPHRHRTLLHHDFAALRNVGNHAGGILHVLEVGSTAAPVAERLRRCIHRNEDQIRLHDGCFDVGGEEQIAVAALLDDGIEAGLCFFF